MSDVRALWYRPARLLAVAVVGVAGCAGPDSRPGASLPADCIPNRDLRDFSALDQRNLVVDGPGQTSYHVVLASPSVYIEGEVAIGVYDDGDGRICPFGRDAILVEGVLRETIRILSIETIDDADVEALQVQFGRLEPAGDAVSVEQIQ